MLDAEDREFIKENEDKSVPSKWRSYLHSRRVICYCSQNTSFQCMDCGQIWSSNILPGGELPRGYTECPRCYRS